MADLKVTITEALKLQGNNQGATHTKTISGINEASRRVVSARNDTAATVLCSFAAADGAGTYKAANLRYLRITNLDSSSYVILSIERTTSTAHYAQVRFDAGKSFISSRAADSIDTQDTSTNYDSVSLVDITGIKARTETGNVDLEVFIATT